MLSGWQRTRFREKLGSRRKIIALTLTYWPYYVLLFLLSLASIPLSLLAPLPLSLIVDDVIGQRSMSEGYLGFLAPQVNFNQSELILIAAIAMIVVTLLQQLDSYGNWLLQTYLGERISLDIKAKLFKHILQLPLMNHKDHHSADFIYRIQNDVPALTFIPIQWIIMISSTMTVFAMIWVTSQLNLELALLAIVVLPFVFMLLKIYEPAARRGWRVFKESESKFFASVKESLSSIVTIKGYGLEYRKTLEMTDQGAKTLSLNTKAMVTESLFGGLVAVVLSLGAALILYLGTISVLDGRLSLGHLILIMGYLSQIFKPVENVAKKAANLQSAMASAQRVLDIFAMSSDEHHQEHKKVIPIKQEIKGHIEISHLYFSYPNGRAILQDVNLDLPPGTFVGILGPSGSGKTSLLHLILGFLKPTSGSIRIDQIPLADYRSSQMREFISVVFQDTILFSGTIADNIAFGLQDVTLEDLEKASRAANALDFIDKLPMRFQTEVGENGVNLSGGERQRIAIARAFLRNTPILILDEPTSSVDQESEALIIDALSRLVQNRTTILVGHRLETFKYCDLRLSLENGGLKVVSNF